MYLTDLKESFFECVDAILLTAFSQKTKLEEMEDIEDEIPEGYQSRCPLCDCNDSFHNGLHAE